MANKILLLACLFLSPTLVSAQPFDADPDKNYVVLRLCSDSKDFSELAEVLAGFEPRAGADWTLILVDDRSRCEGPRSVERRSRFRRISITR